MKRAHLRLTEAGPSDLTAPLAYDGRHRRRLVVDTREGEKVLLDLPSATRLRDGDRLMMDDGRILKIAAEPEPVCDIHAGDPHTMTRIAWHLGNRHTPTAIFADRLRIRRDHVLEEMAERLGGRVERLDAPFDPEAGAYADGGRHTHAHDHDDDHHNH